MAGVSERYAVLAGSSKDTVIHGYISACSCCLSGDDLIDMKENYVDYSGRVESYLEAVNGCYNSMLLDSSKLPTNVYICHQCAQHLANAYTFLLNIIEAQKKLISNFNKVKGVSRTIKRAHEDETYSLGFSYVESEYVMDNEEFEHEEVLTTDWILPEDKYAVHQKEEIGEQSVPVKLSPEKTRRKIAKSANVFADWDFRIPKPVTKRQESIDPNEPGRAKKKDTINAKSELDAEDVSADQPMEITKYVKPKRRAMRSKRLSSMELSNNRLATSEMMASMDLENLECKVCSKKFLTEYSLRRHANVHFANYACRECGSKFSTRDRLLRHLQRSHLKGDHRCNKCQMTFVTKSKLLYHKKTHSSSCVCRVCNIRFPSYYQCLSHMRSAHGVEGKHPCKLCPVRCLTASMLCTHVRKKHTVRERSFVCDYCNGTFFSKTEVRLHMSKHTGERDYKCNECDKAFNRKHYLMLHMKIHYNIRDYICEHCGADFIHKITFRNHMKRCCSSDPIKTEPVVCNVCLAEFINEKQFREHKRKDHPIIRTVFYCSECNESFKRKKDYVEHRFSHSKANFHACTICKLSFEDAYSLRIHITKVHNNNLTNYKCKVCKMNFKYLVSFKVHVMKHKRELQYPKAGDKMPLSVRSQSNTGDIIEVNDHDVAASIKLETPVKQEPSKKQLLVKLIAETENDYVYQVLET